MVKFSSETVTDYVIRAETATAALTNCGENITDSLLIAIVLKGLKAFVGVVTQSDSKQTFTEFKAALRSFEDTENARSVNSDSVMQLRMRNVSVSSPSRLSKDLKCYNCGGNHFARDCHRLRRDFGATIANAQPIMIRLAGGRGILEGEVARIG